MLPRFGETWNTARGLHRTTGERNLEDGTVAKRLVWMRSAWTRLRETRAKISRRRPRVVTTLRL